MYVVIIIVTLHLVAVGLLETWFVFFFFSGTSFRADIHCKLHRQG